MRKYMWPNSCLPSATALISAANSGSEGRFTLEGVENHAARTSDLNNDFSPHIDVSLTQTILER